MENTIESLRRNTAIDSMKGVGILLMILGHSSIPFPLYRVIYTFHIPLFFILCGYLYKDRTMSETIKHGYRKVLVPYLWCLLLCSPICFYYYRTDWLLTCIFTKNTPATCGFEWEGNSGPLWFFVAYFNTVVAFGIIKKINSKYLVPIFLLLLFEISLLVRSLSGSLLPFQIFQTTGGLLFAYVGHVGRKVISQYKSHVFNIVLCTIIFIPIAYYGCLSMSAFEYPLNLFHILGGISGTVLLYYFTRIIKLQFLAFIGRNSLLILCFHSIDYNFRGGIQLASFLCANDAWYYSMVQFSIHIILVLLLWGLLILFNKILLHNILNPVIRKLKLNVRRNNCL